ncbi:MAG: metallophosphoesterase family protein [Dissulfuribacterales bacterium]
MIFVKFNHPEVQKHALNDQNPMDGHTIFTLVHLSDPHLFLPDDVMLKDILNKRVYGYLSWHIHRGREYSETVLSALMEEITSAGPGHIAVTGDLTHLGLPKEFLAAKKWLTSLGPPSKVTVIPGNHDSYVAMPWEQTFRLWSDYMISDPEYRGNNGAGNDRRVVFPSLRVRNGIALIGVSTAGPSPLFFATGSIGKTQLMRLENILIETQQKGLFRVILIHHPPISGAVSWRKRLVDQPAFQRLIEIHGADLVLYGHTHRVSSGYLKTPFGKISLIGIPSISAIGRNAARRARYHLFKFIKNKDGLALFIIVRVYSLSKRRFVDEETRQIKIPAQDKV